MTSVQLPDGSIKEFESSVTVKEVAKSIGRGLAKAALWGEIDLQPVPLDHKIEGTKVPLKIITNNKNAALETMRHSCAHVMARAVMRIKKGSIQLAFGPTTDNGFYYDFMLEKPLTEDDFPKIEAEMAKIIELDEPFERLVEPREKAVQICADLKQ